jgi:Cu2+-exporting ATPase
MTAVASPSRAQPGPIEADPMTAPGAGPARPAPVDSTDPGAAPATAPVTADARWRAFDDPAHLASFTHWQATPDGRRVAVSQFQLSGMHCAACSDIIERAVGAVPGVLGVEVSASSQRAEVRWDPQRVAASALVAAVDRAGYGAVPDAAAPARAERLRERRQALWRLFVAGFCMMQVMMYATPAYVAGPGDLSPDVLALLQWASWVLSVPVVIFSAGPFFRGAWRSLAARRIGMDVPVALGIAVTFVASSWATFDPGGLFGHEVYFDSLTMFVFFLLGGRFVEMGMRHRAATALESSLARLPETVDRLDADDRPTPVAPARLVPGDRVRIDAGQAFAADGVLLQGRTHADEALLTGESTPVAKAAGDAVVAGSLNLDAPVVMRVERVGADTRYEGIVALMRGALTQRPAMVRAADRIAGPFLWAVLAIAALAAIGWAFVDPSRSVWVAVAVLVVTCPCALSLAAPSALLAAAGHLARRGVLLRRLDALEALSRVDTVFLDKTGTLTEDRVVVSGVESLDPALLPDEVERLRSRAGALAAWSRHPLSRAIAAQAADAAAQGGPGALRWHDVQDVPGRGVLAVDDEGREWRLGRERFVIADGARGAAGGEPEPIESAARVQFGPAGRPLLAFRFDEVLRSDAGAAVQALQRAGLAVTVLSGDERDRAQATAARLGIAVGQGGATPEAKLAAVAEAQAGGRVVAMVGDGLNDAPVLAKADVSFALAHGAAVSQSQADAILLANRLGDVVASREVAQRAMRIVHQNFAWSIAYNVIGIPLAVVGWLPPWVAGIGMAASSLFVIANAQRLARVQAPRKEVP